MNRNFDRCCKCDAQATVDNAAGCRDFPCPLLDTAEKDKDSSMHGAQFYKDVRHHRRKMLRFIYWGKKLWHSHRKLIIRTAIFTITVKFVDAYLALFYDIFIRLISALP